jgi:tetracycline repressor-like protein
MPDTGSLVGDLQALIDAVPEFDEGAGRQLEVFYGVATAASREPELKAALTANVLEVPRRVLREVFARAVARGEVPAERDLELLPEIVLGLNFLRFQTSGIPDRESRG